MPEMSHCKRCQMIVEKETCMTLIAMVYSAVAVVMMKIVHKMGETIQQEQAKPD